ncbi:MAG TPA: hypothetical protein G4O02_00650 [Caldilineae bacterium]|nr:hypothetical protein [Caldilineae bacterium]
MRSDIDRIDRVRYWLWISSLGGAILLFIVGIMSLAVYALLSRQPAVIHGWRDPTNAVVATRIRPDLALLPLAGIPSETAAREALDAGEPDSAFAIVVYASDLDNATRGGLFELIGERFADMGRLSEASLCFQMAHDLAALGPDVADLARFDLSLSAARGRLRVKDEVGVALSLEQAETLIRYSALMQPVQRKQALDRLERLVAVARGKRAAAELRARVGDDVTVQPSILLPRSNLAALADPLPLNPDLERVRLERQRRALALINQWIALEGGDVGPERADLAEFLRREDQARVTWYVELAEPGRLSPGQQVTLLSEQIVWLLIKLQAARGAYGISLVPEWEGAEPEIYEALRLAQGAFFSLLRQRVGDLADPEERDWAELELVRLELANWRLGHYPGLDPDDRDQALAAVVHRIRARLSDGGMQPGSGVWPMARTTDDRRDYILIGGPAP